MSTADSQLLAASSSVSQNIVREVLVKDLSEKKAMIIARITLIVIALIAIVIAWNPQSSVFGIVSFAWAGFGAAFGPTMLAALFWKRSNKYGALAGMISGGIMVFLWKYVISTLGGAFAIYELLPAFLVGLIFNIVVSLLTEAPSEEIQKEFDEVAAEMKKG
jgi:sodium/proline symporter